MINCNKVAALVACAMSQSIATAQALPASNVQLYGLIDLGLDRTSNVQGTKRNRVASGQWTGSNWGVRGTEDTGGGVQAMFQLEAGINADTGESILATTFYDRRAVVGLQ